MSAAFDRVTAALEAADCKRGNSWLCPGHDDRNPSLSVKDAGDKVLVTCHAGCTFEEIAAALKLERRDFFEDDSWRRGRGVPGGPSTVQPRNRWA